MRHVNTHAWQWPAALDAAGAPVADYIEAQTERLMRTLRHPLPAAWRTPAALGLVLFLRSLLSALILITC